MSRENTNELRERLLANADVQNMIRARAFELYERSGRAPGRDAENWFKAEQDVISFLIEEEQRRADDIRRSGNTTASVPESEISALATKGEQTAGENEEGARTAQTAEERAESQSALGVWSATEPISEERAPSIAEPTKSTIEAPAPKKKAPRASSKTSATKSAGSRKKKQGESGAKAEAKKPAAKSTARNTSSKNADEAGKSTKE